MQAAVKLQIQSLVDALPELYQPVYGFPQAVESSSRPCLDRWSILMAVYKLLVLKKKRPLRVLDLGCAQGFFSFKLASVGAEVVGVDFNEKNIALCKALAEQHPSHKALFYFDDIQSFIKEISPHQFDLVLGLSVFHHLVHEKGLASVQSLVSVLAERIDAGVYELALKQEPLYWSNSLPENPLELLQSYHVTAKLSHIHTHLSAISRPLYFVTNETYSDSVKEILNDCCKTK